jgi:uncharacterized protein (TIGR02145 family)
MRKRLKIYIGLLIGLVMNSYTLQSQLPPIHFQTMLRNVQWIGDSLICQVKLFPSENSVQPEYLEEHHLPWNDNEYLSILIGSGNPALGNWNELAWDNPSKKVKIDFWQGGQWVNWVSQTFPFVPKAQTVLQGWQGPIGEVGPTGVQGSMGAQGLTGSQGVPGSMGLPGIEVDSISSSGAGNFIQWLSDGTTREWSFPNWPLGCMDETACNYSSNALINDGSCLYAQSACDDGDDQTFSDALDAICQCVGTYALQGCTDPSACNFIIGSNFDDGSCRYFGTNCDHPDSFIVNEVIDTECSCKGIWKDYTIVNSSGYKAEVKFLANDIVYLSNSNSFPYSLDSIWYKSILLENAEWAVDNHSTLVFSDLDSIPLDGMNNCRCRQQSVFCQWHGADINCKDVLFKSPMELFYEESIYPGSNWLLSDCQRVVNSFQYRYSVLVNGNLCPSGWHVATDSDWQNLINFFGGDEYAGQRIGIENWYNYSEPSYNDFSGLSIMADQDFSENTSASWWSPTEDAPPGKMWIRKVVSNSPKVYRYLVDANEYHSVRCVKNP